MADEKPTEWSLSKNQPIGNYGTKVDARLSTISPSNPEGYVLLSTTSKDSIINGDFVKLHYAIDNNGRVTYADIDNQGNIRRTYDNIQQIAWSGQFGYTPETTLRIKDSLRVNLIQRTQSIILSASSPPVQPRPDPGGGNPRGNPQNQGNGESGTGSDSPEDPPEEGAEALTNPGPITAVSTKVSFTGILNKERLQYPLEMTSLQDKIKFWACEIEERGEGSGEGLQFQFGKPVYKNVSIPVFLAIQSPISDQNSVEWGSNSINAIESALYHESLDFMNSNRSEIAGKIQDFAGEIQKSFKNYSEATRKYLAGQAASVNNILARTDNAILNPNLELLFQAPTLRPFTFQFKLSARNGKEAKEIKNIIKYFKYHMAVRKSPDQLFLKAPYVFTIQYLKGDNKNHPGINLISPDDNKKACALTNFSVDYTPLGSYMTYADEDATMVSYNLSLQFQEIEAIYNTDYENPSHTIGF